MDLVPFPLHPIYAGKFARFKSKKGGRGAWGRLRWNRRFRLILTDLAFAEPVCFANETHEYHTERHTSFHLSLSFGETLALRLLRPRWSSGVRRMVTP